MAKLQGQFAKILKTTAAAGAAGAVGITSLFGASDMNLLQRNKNNTQQEGKDVTLKWGTDSELVREDDVTNGKKGSFDASYVGTGVIPDLFKDYIKAGSIGKTRAQILANAASQVSHSGYLWGAMQPWSAPMSDYGWFDCSHFQYWCYTNNITTKLQGGYMSCSFLLGSSEYKQISLKDARPGDLLVCSGHVMMFIGYTKNPPLKLVVVDCGGGGASASFPPTLSGRSFDNVENYYTKGVRFKPVSLYLETTPGVSEWVGDNSNTDRRYYKLLRNIKLEELDTAEQVVSEYSNETSIPGVNNENAKEVGLINGYVKVYDKPTKIGKYDKVEVPMSQRYISEYGGKSSYVTDKGLGFGEPHKTTTWTMGEGRGSGFNDSLMGAYRSKEDSGFTKGSCTETVPGVGFYTYEGRYLVAAGIGLFISREATATFFAEHNAKQSGFQASEYYDRQNWDGHKRSLCFDVVLRDSSGNNVYLPCILGDAKAHNYDTGIIQTGIHCTQTSYTGKNDSKTDYADGSLVEFVGTSASAGARIGNFGNGYVVDSVIVYWIQ